MRIIGPYADHGAIWARGHSNRIPKMKISEIVARYQSDQDFEGASGEIWKTLGDRNVTRVPLAYLRWEIATIVLVRLVEDQTRNGGIDALFCNGWGECAEMCASALEDVGASRKASILRTVMDSYWGGRYPRTSAEWERICDTVPDDEEMIPGERELERAYYRKDSENVEALIVAFVSNNVEAFEPHTVLPH